MTEQLWSAVDNYYTTLLGASDPVMENVLAASQAAGLPAIQVSPLQGRMLMLLAQAAGARRILEIGTLGGYSSIWLARGLPHDGVLVTLESEPHHAEVATANIARAGFSAVTEVVLAPALDSLAELVNKGVRPFDLIFIDADKPNYPAYLEWALKLAWPGSLIVADNMVRGGAVADAESSDPAVVGARQFNDLLAKNDRLSATAIQTVGAKGYDGFVLARVIA
jgi:predicted O-methyltransferase YrrM